MMKISFEISLNMKTAKGLETYGRFYLGDDEHFANQLFGLLEGEDGVKENSVISMDLIKRENDIPYPLHILHCNWEHLAYNTKMITKELFKELNLE